MVPYRPDIVLVNFCSNDWLPTEDPYGNTVEVYKDYFTRLLNGADYALDDEERGFLQTMLDAADLAELDTRLRPHRSRFRKWLIDIPIIEMDRLAKNGIRSDLRPDSRHLAVGTL